MSKTRSLDHPIITHNSTCVSSKEGDFQHLSRGEYQVRYTLAKWRTVASGFCVKSGYINMRLWFNHEYLLRHYSIPVLP